MDVVLELTDHYIEAIKLLHTTSDTTTIQCMASANGAKRKPHGPPRTEHPRASVKSPASHIPAAMDCFGEQAAVARVGPTVRHWSSEPDRVYDLLRDDLLAGLFAPHEALVESVLADRYEASRTPVRTALVRLVSDQLLEARPHSMTIVRDVTARDIRQIYEIRQALEGFAAEAAAATIDRDELTRLIASYDARFSAQPSGTSSESSERGVTPLHFLIAHSAGNKRLTRVLCEQSLPLVRMHALYWRAARARADALETARRADALKEHLAIAGALLEGSASQARSLIVDHLRNAAEYLIDLISSVDLDNISPGAESHASRTSLVALDHMIPGQEPLRTDPLG